MEECGNYTWVLTALGQGGRANQTQGKEGWRRMGGGMAMYIQGKERGRIRQVTENERVHLCKRPKQLLLECQVNFRVVKIQLKFHV